MSVELFVQIAVFVVIVGAQFVAKLVRERQQNQAPPPREHPEPEWEPEPVWEPAADVERSAAVFAPPAIDSERDRLRARLDALVAEAEVLRDSVRRDRAADELGPVVEGAVIEPARTLAADLDRDTGPLSPWAHGSVAELAFILGWLDTFIAQRRDPRRRAQVCDADALARACYRPLMDFARINRVPLTSAVPVTFLGPFDLSTWTGFLPTGAAPIFLPPSFFQGLVWWPALAHEIAHDFLAATEGADDAVRHQLGVPGEARGQLALDPSRGVDATDLHRVFGAWFEEMFCDLVGVLMLGPAYGHTMVELFARPGPYGAEEVAAVDLDHTGTRYDTHPPRHLRVLWCARALELVGEDEAAGDVRADWQAHHGPIDHIVMPSTGGLLAIPVAPLEAMGVEIIERLHGEPLAGFDGHSLSAMPGVDWGPRLGAESRRAAADLLAGRRPGVRDPRAIIAGAILARRAEPEREAYFLDMARATLVGKQEWVDGGQPGPVVAVAAAARDANPAYLRECFILHTVLAPPKARAFLPPVQRNVRFRGF